MAISITAVIPTYNCADYIADCIHSVRNQSYPVKEIVIVDDGSTDQTEQVVKKLGDNIVYIKQPNQGPSAARNTGIKAAKSDWIAFLDADDQWTPDKTACQLDVLENNPSVVLIASDMAEIDRNGNMLVNSVLAKHGLLVGFVELGGKPIPNALAALLQKNFIPTGTVLVQRSNLLEIGLFDPDIRYGEDLALWSKIAEKYPICCVPKVLLLRRQHGANATQATVAMLDDLVKVMLSVRTWGSDTLRRQGVNPNRLIASAWNNVGYYHFANNDAVPARQAFLNSLRESITLKGLVYFVFSSIPQSWASSLRTIKQRLFKTKD